MPKVRPLAVFVVAFVLAAAIRAAGAEPVTVRWDPNPPEEMVLGYVVTVETAPGVVVLVQDVGKQTVFVFPDAVPDEEYLFSVTAYNASGQGPASPRFPIFSNATPILNPPGNLTMSLGQSVSVPLHGSDRYGEVLAYSVTGLPPGATVDAATGLISGVPTTSGVFTMEATVTDGTLSTSRSFSWIVDGAPPTVTLVSPTTESSYSTAGSTIVVSGTASDELAIASVSWANNRGGSGTAIGTNVWSTPVIPLFVGVNVISVTAGDAVGHTTTATLSVTSPGAAPPAITIVAPTGSPSFVTSSDRIAMSGAASGGGGVASVTWASNRGGSGAASLNSSTGTTAWSVSQVLLQPGANVITVTATNPSGNSSQATLTVTWNQVPALTNPGPLSSLQGAALTQALAALDPEGGSLTWSATSLPAGLSINASTGAISGTPTTPGSYNVTLTVSDGTGTSQTVFTWTILSAIPGPATPVSPSGSIGTMTPQFVWTAVNAATYYLLSIEDGSAVSPIHTWYTPAQAGCSSGVGTCTVQAPRSLTSGLVRWMVLTWSPGGYGPWSSTKETIVDVADGATPTPATLGPSGPIATRTPTYSWTPVAGAIWYQLSVTDALNVTKLYWFDPDLTCVSATCSMAPTIVLAIGPAQWQVRAWRASGAGAWSTPVSFETADAAPGKATLIAPSTPIPSSTPTFTWNAVVGTSYYLLQAVDRDNVEIERWYKPSQVGCPLGTGTCSASAGGALHPGPANWRVLTWNGSGYGPWSDPFTFTVEIADPAAGIPQTISPTGTIATPNAAYTWSSVAAAVSYRLAISNNGQSETYWWFSPAAAGCLASTPCTVIPQAGLQSGTATWRVQTWTVNGHSDWSAAVPLTVAVPAPTAPALVSPSGSTTATTQFVWNASPSTTLYFVRVYDATGLRVERWLTPDAAGCPVGTGSCTMNAGVTLNSGSGSWEALAWNASGYSPWSQRSFTVP